MHRDHNSTLSVFFLIYSIVKNNFVRSITRKRFGAICLNFTQWYRAVSRSALHSNHDSTLPVFLNYLAFKKCPESKGVNSVLCSTHSF